MEADRRAPRLATVGDAVEVAQLLHDFNTEFSTPSPGVAVLADRLRLLLDGESTVALLSGSPAMGLALVTLRPNVWYDGPVALLDELYVVPHLRGRGVGSKIIEGLLALADDRGVGLIEINVDEGDVDARRFYERHGFCGTQTPASAERSFYYWRELTTSPQPSGTTAGMGRALQSPKGEGSCPRCGRRLRDQDEYGTYVCECG